MKQKRDEKPQLEGEQLEGEQLEGEQLEGFEEDLTNIKDVTPAYIGPETDFLKSMNEAKLEIIKENQTQRKIYARNTFELSVYWLAACIGIIIFTGLGKLELSDAVIITLITTTTASVLIFFRMVMRYLFNINDNFFK